MDEVKKATPRASAEDWLALESACSLLRLPSSAFARCLIDLRDCFLDELRPRVAAAQPTPAAPDGKTNHQWSGGIAVPNEDGWMITQVQPSAPAADSTAAPGARSVLTRSVIAGVNTAAYPPGKVIMTTPTPAAAPDGGVTLAEMAEVMEEACALRTLDAARYLLSHPRIGPLLRGEGGKRAVLAEVPTSGIAGMAKRQSRDPCEWLAGWTAARAEVARQQGEQP